MDPSGFIYHETRCGSTLSANMMAAVPSNIVHRSGIQPTVGPREGGREGLGVLAIIGIVDGGRDSAVRYNWNRGAIILFTLSVHTTAAVTAMYAATGTRYPP